MERSCTVQDEPKTSLGAFARLANAVGGLVTAFAALALFGLLVAHSFWPEHIALPALFLKPLSEVAVHEALLLALLVSLLIRRD